MLFVLVYGFGGGGGVFVFEFNCGKVISGLVVNNYVWVQDVCCVFGLEEICEVLQDEYDENEYKLKQVFKSEQVLFEKCEVELQV